MVLSFCSGLAMPALRIRLIGRSTELRVLDMLCRSLLKEDLYVLSKCSNKRCL
jgi:hypothetical protein